MRVSLAAMFGIQVAILSSVISAAPSHAFSDRARRLLTPLILRLLDSGLFRRRVIRSPD